jgi:3-dehydroquinate dehydratase II
MNLLLIQGANMEYLGKRQPEIYGTTTAAELDALLTQEAKRRNVGLEIRYTNTEGEAISWIFDAERRGIAGLLMNPAGFVHAGYALRDCWYAIQMPVIEIHMSNIDKRHIKSVTAEAARGMVMGLGVQSYLVAIDAMVRVLSAGKTTGA